MTFPLTILDGTFCSIWTCVVCTLYSVVAYTGTVQLTVLIRVEVLMDFVVNTIVNAATLSIWYTLPITVKKPRFAETAFFAFHCQWTCFFYTVRHVAGTQVVFTVLWTGELYGGEKKAK